MTPLQQHLATYNTNIEIGFNEEEHRYFDVNDPSLVFVSATQLIDKVKKPYDKEFWAMYTGLKNALVPVKPEPEIRSIYVHGVLTHIDKLKKSSLYIHYYNQTVAKWAGMTEEACIKGSNTHNYLEDSINESKGIVKGMVSDNYRVSPDRRERDSFGTTMNNLDQTSLKSTYPFIYERLQEYIRRDCIIYAEKRLRLDFALIAGMIDVPIIKRGTNKFCITDWKTNKDELHWTSGYYQKIKVGGGWVRTDNWIATNDKMLYPLAHLPSSKMYTYALQLSLYAYILECWGYELVNKGLEIIHLRTGFAPKVIKVPYLRDDIERLILWRLNELGRPFSHSNYINELLKV